MHRGAVFRSDRRQKSQLGQITERYAAALSNDSLAQRNCPNGGSAASWIYVLSSCVSGGSPLRKTKLGPTPISVIADALILIGELSRTFEIGAGRVFDPNVM